MSAKPKLVYSSEIPPIYPQLREKFGADWDNGVIIAYDGRIHAKEVPAPQKWIHEGVHLDRQKEIGNEAFWRLYLESDQFRLEEELLAYLAEADFIKKNIRDREARFHLIMEIARGFSSSLYGGIIGTQEAYRLLK